MTPEQAADRLELRALVEEYAWLSDSRDYDGFGALFLPDAVVTVRAPGAHEPFARIEGRDAIAQIPHGNDGFAQTFHAIHNHRAELDGDRASGITYCVARHHLEAKNEVVIVPLRYFDTYARTAMGWRFSERDLRFAWVEKAVADRAALTSWIGQDTEVSE